MTSSAFPLWHNRLHTSRWVPASSKLCVGFFPGGGWPQFPPVPSAKSRTPHFYPSHTAFLVTPAVCDQPISLAAWPIQMLLVFPVIGAFVFVCALPAVGYAAQISFDFAADKISRPHLQLLFLSGLFFRVVLLS